MVYVIPFHMLFKKQISMIKINFLTSFLYKLISRILAKIIFSYKDESLVRNYVLPINLINKYYFLYPCYKLAFKEILFKEYENCIENKSFVIYPKVNNKKDYLIKNNNNIYIIGNNLLKVNLQLCETSIKLSSELNIKNIFFKSHPRSNFKISNFNKRKYLIKKDQRDVTELESNNSILISYSSLLPYFLNKNFNVYICTRSLLLELKTKEKYNSYIRIYKNAYPENKLIFL